MKFKIKYYGGISNWLKAANCTVLIDDDSVIFRNFSVFGINEYAILFSNIDELRFKASEEQSWRGGLNNYIVGKYILRSNFLGAVGASLGLKKIEIGTFRVVYRSNEIRNIVKFTCSKGASTLFNELQKRLR